MHTVYQKLFSAVGVHQGTRESKTSALIELIFTKPISKYYRL